MLPNGDSIEPFLALFVIFPAAQGKNIPIRSKSFCDAETVLSLSDQKMSNRGRRFAWYFLCSIYSAQITSFCEQFHGLLIRRRPQCCQTEIAQRLSHLYSSFFLPRRRDAIPECSKSFRKAETVLSLAVRNCSMKGKWGIFKFFVKFLWIFLEGYAMI